MLRRRMQAFVLATCGAAADRLQRETVAAVAGLGTDPAQLQRPPFAASRRCPPTKAVAVGYTFPNSCSCAAVGLRRYWRVLAQHAVPGHRDVSFQLYDCTRSDDGFVWACGGILPLARRSLLGAAGRLPLRRRVGRGRARFDADVNGIILHGIEACGSGAGFELRVAGERADQTVWCCNTANGGWKNMSLPVPAPNASWGLVSVARRDRWDVVHRRVHATTRRAAWSSPIAAPAGKSSLDRRCPACISPTSRWIRTRNTPWFTRQRNPRDSLEGTLFALRSGTFVHTPIARLSGGGYRLFAIDFDAQGHGWVGGGRTLHDPFWPAT
jgi:hypothetical protein